MDVMIARQHSYVPPIAVVLLDSTQVSAALSPDRVLELVAEAPELKGFAVVIAWKSGPTDRLQFHGNPQACGQLNRSNTLLLEQAFQPEALTLRDVPG